jgi:SpoVK/Ycf46/Vps4 family AAA+-type ATPase
MTISAFEKSYPQSNKELMKQIDNYSRACALYLWSAFNVGPDLCVDAINVIYSSTVGPITYTETNVRAAMERLSSRNYSMPVPKFFYDIIAYDMKCKTNISRRLAACFQLLDISYAMIDKNVQEEEADIIAALQKDLLKECDSKKIVAFKKDTDPHRFVTPSYEEKLFVTARKTGEMESVVKEKVGKSEKQIQSSSLKSSMDELETLIGLSKAKREIREISDFTKVQKARQEQGLPTSDVSFHLVFTGNPGTGKTTVARLVAKIYKDLGIVSKGHLTEVSAKDLVAGYVGQTAIKTGEVVEKALGGVLFIDEAYTLLDKAGQGFGQEAIDTLLKEMEDKRGDFAVIVAGYDDLMHEFINSNPGLKSRFNKYIHFDDYTAEEMYDIFGLLCAKGAYEVNDDAKKLIKNHFSVICASKDDSFANGRTVRNEFESIISKQASRIAATKGEKTKGLLSTIEVEDVEKCIGKMNEEEKLEDVLMELNALTGLDKVKEEITELVYIVQNQQRRKAQGLNVPSLSLHLVFMGNPGTGKTTVARCVARIYKCLGLLSKGQLIETDRSGLVAGYVGQTAIKTQNVIKTALGGVLFVDEAYTLVNGGGNDFAQEAIDTLLKVMEDQRNDLVVIVAGYDDLMNDFIHSNPGLESRFNRYIHFEDYTAEQMLSIFNSFCGKNQYILSDNASEMLLSYFGETDISKIGNGRGARNFFEKVVTQQAKRIERLSEGDVDLQIITADDIQTARRGE